MRKKQRLFTEEKETKSQKEEINEKGQREREREQSQRRENKEPKKERPEVATTGPQEDKRKRCRPSRIFLSSLSRSFQNQNEFVIDSFVVVLEVSSHFFTQSERRREEKKSSCGI